MAGQTADLHFRAGMIRWRQLIFRRIGYEYFIWKIKTFLWWCRRDSSETSRIGSKDMVSLLKNHLAETGGKPGGIPYLGMIHRLDQPVQGVMVFAKNQKVVTFLSKEIAQNEKRPTSPS